MNRVGRPGTRASAIPAAVRIFLAREPKRLGAVLVALSGGPDSVALLHATAIEAKAAAVSVTACWVDHAIRPEAELAAEREFVVGLCERLGVPLIVEALRRGAVEAAAKAEGGIEAAARRFRYDALERARIASSSDLVLTGHNADDRVETLLMRFCSGSGVAGLRGIPAVAGMIGRPLLGLAKADILAYLDAEGLDYRVDSTNDSDAYLRNRVRHRLVPAAMDVFPSLRASLATVAEKASLDEEALSALADALFGLGDDGARADWLEAGRYDAAPEAVRIRALYSLAMPLFEGAGATRLPWRLVRAAASSARREGVLASGAGVLFSRNGGRIEARQALGPHLSRLSAPAGADRADSGFSLIANGPGSYRIGKGGGCTIYSCGQAPGLRADAFSWPLCVRSRRPGDRLATRGGAKRVDAILSELGLSGASREATPVVEDALGLVAVLASSVGLCDVYRRNDALVGEPVGGYLVVELKGVMYIDAVRR